MKYGGNFFDNREKIQQQEQAMRLSESQYGRNLYN